MKVLHKMAFRSKLGAIVTCAVLFILFNKLMFTSLHETENLSDSHRLAMENKKEFEHGADTFLHFQNKSKNMTLIKKYQSLEHGHLTDKKTIYNETNDRVDAKGKPPVNLKISDNYMSFIKDVQETDLQDPLVNKHQYQFSLDNRYACNGNVFLLALVHSSTTHTKERAIIRSTWGSVRYYSGAVIVPMFLLGQVGHNNTKEQAEIVKESNTYRDIIQGNFIDSYKNLTIKNVMGLHWSKTHCNNTKFVLKTDDDTLVDVYHLVHFLFQKSPDGNLENFLYCSTFQNQGPRRDTVDKWFVTQSEYPFSKYPPYCEGFAYVMSYDVSEKLYEASRSVKYYWIDDVLVTGFLALKAGVSHKDMEYGHAYNLLQSEHLSKHVQYSIFLLAKYSHLRKNWDKAWSDIQTINKIGD